MKKRAFTLIELLVVIAILAILIAIVIPNFTKSTEKAHKTANQANVRVLMAAGATYLAENGNPDKELTWLEDNEGWKPYLQSWPESFEGKSYKLSIMNNGEVNVYLGDELQVLQDPTEKSD